MTTKVVSLYSDMFWYSNKRCCTCHC